ncbi:transmembrane amino acid transporter protein-domain-containing protein [Phakopsora pachyrhizi]|uniref:Transmembrane amino acid transporter protein-domain-containing protein n=1 Tax=Phakopsora pachyrhizi TaxID=170000 RepID=A0AAV0BI13_PHAPC|nr:transmembrane amino acid transporter protein-domain-containing protein [Phakopsora pachyrhizi]CAH7685578.1 transmembrane amino acid transporter protein-domain-containing protein [Phakopsora pachyrhizi]
MGSQLTNSSNTASSSSLPDQVRIEEEEEEEDDDDGYLEDGPGRRNVPKTKLGSATMVSCVANLSNTILGTGMLAMAHGFAQGGLILGWTTVLICGMMGYFGLYLLSLCASHPRIPTRGASFFEVSKITYPRAGAFFDSAISIKCFGVSISYLLIFGKLMPQVIISFFGPYDSNEGLDSLPLILDRKFWITVSMFILIPLSFLRRLDSLRYTSYVALVAVINLLVVVTFYKFFASSDIKPPGSIEIIRLDSSFLTALPLFVFAYTCAQNLFPVHNELRVNSVKQKKKVLMMSIGSAILIYEFIGTIGYLTFGSKVSSNLISDYPHSTFISISRLSISILVLFSYPLQIHPCRTSLTKVFFSDDEVEGDRQNIKDDRTGDNYEVDDQRGLDKSYFRKEDYRFFGITTLLLLSSFLISINVERLETVLGFVGSTGSTTISYILPGFYFLKLFPSESSRPMNQAEDESIEELSESGELLQTDQNKNLKQQRRITNMDDDEFDEQLNWLMVDKIRLLPSSTMVKLGYRKLRLVRILAKALILIGFFIMVVCLILNIHDAFF